MIVSLRVLIHLSSLQANACRVIDAYRTGNIFYQILGLLCLKSFKLQRMCEEVANIRTAIKVRQLRPFDILPLAHENCRAAQLRHWGGAFSKTPFNLRRRSLRPRMRAI